MSSTKNAKNKPIIRILLTLINLDNCINYGSEKPKLSPESFMPRPE